MRRIIAKCASSGRPVSSFFSAGVGALTLLSGCLFGGDEPPEPPEPLTCEDVRTTEYRIDAITIPTRASEASALSLDIDADRNGRPDNAMGSMLSTFLQVFDTAAEQLPLSIDAALAEEAAWLIRIEQCEGARQGPVRLSLGREDAAPLEDRLAARAAAGSIASGRVEVSGGVGAAPISIFGDVLGGHPVAWSSAAGVAATLTVTDDALTGVLAMAVPEDAQTLVAPAFADYMTSRLQAGTLENTADWDADGDGTITAAEVLEGDEWQLLLGPDVDMLAEHDGQLHYWPGYDGERDSISLGIGIEASRVR